MIRLYTSKEEIPQNKIFINNIDLYFNTLIDNGKLIFDKFDKHMISSIDNSRVSADHKYINTPFSNHISSSYISTGVKTLILAHHFTDNVINISMCGRNVLDILFTIENANYYLSYCITPNKMKPVMVNNTDKVYMTPVELLEIWENEE